MPYTCFSYQRDVPLSARNRAAAQPAPAGLRKMPYPCFSYPLTCFGYPADVPLGARNHGATRSVLPGLRRMPDTGCFRY